MHLNATRLLFAFFLSVFPIAGLLHAQNEVSFEANADAKQVLLDGYFEVAFTLKNANGTDFTPPSFKDFIILAGPGTSTSMQVINGTVTRETSLTYTLQPKKAGKFTIGSASIRANGRKMVSKSITVEVVKNTGSQQNGRSGGGDAFVRVVPGKTKAYLGEQVSLDIKLFTAVDIEGYDIPEYPEYEGFYAQELRNFPSNIVQEVVNGRQYTTRVLRRIALFPQQTGKLTIEPFRVQLGMIDEEDRTASGFFFRRNVRPVFVTTEAVSITVDPLPANSPASFCGAVGAYSIQAAVNKKDLTTDDAFSVSVSIEGNGDPKRIQAPPLVLSDSFEVYPPKLTNEQFSELQGEIVHRKVLEYLVLPKFPGRFTIKPEVAYFDPELPGYEAFSSEGFLLNVRQGTGKPANDRADGAAAAQPSDELRPIITTATLVKKGSPFVFSAIFWGLMALPVLGFVGLLFYKKNKDKAQHMDAGLLKAQQAGREAQRRLATAQQFMAAQNARGFYDEVSKASLGYVCDKLSIPLSQLTKDNVRGKLQASNVDNQLIERFMVILQRCEMALYAGLGNPADMASTYDQAVEVISAMERGGNN